MDRTEKVLAIFSELSRIPRKSGNRGPVTDWIRSWAEKRGFDHSTDGYDNVVIRVPSTPGRERDDTVVLQGHSDMVCEKTPESDHDFTTDPLELYREGDWLKARDTTLGADNGIALAMAFDLAENSEISRPPLEILVTSDEEIGLDGANALEPGFIGGRQLINIDSEDEGVFTVGCAGGMDCLFDYACPTESKAGQVYSLVIDGLAGGHSGIDINSGRGSAVKLMARMVQDLLRDDEIRLISFNSGSGATNAIARRGECRFLSPVKADYTAWLNRWTDTFKLEMGLADPNLRIVLEDQGYSEASVLSQNRSLLLTDMIMAVPHGVMGLSREIDDLVETSNNLAFVMCDINQGETVFHLGTSQRSSVMSRLVEVNARVESVARLAGCGNVATKNKYPAWQPNWNSALLARSKKIYKELFGKDAVVEVIHAGLETGVIGAKYEGMDMISIGPTIRHPHSPEEKLLISTIDNVYSFICELIK